MTNLLNTDQQISNTSLCQNPSPGQFVVRQTALLLGFVTRQTLLAVYIAQHPHGIMDNVLHTKNPLFSRIF